MLHLYCSRFAAVATLTRLNTIRSIKVIPQSLELCIICRKICVSLLDRPDLLHELIGSWQVGDMISARQIFPYLRGIAESQNASIDLLCYRVENRRLDRTIASRPYTIVRMIFSWPRQGSINKGYLVLSF